MAERTNISWADHTFNPWIGCMKVGPACDGCYADALMGMGGRAPRAAWGGPGKGVGTRERTAPANWKQPLAWNRAAAAAGARPFVFCASLADVFDNHQDLGPWRHDLFELIRETPNLVWLLLTKRPQNIISLYRRDAFDPDPATWPRNAAIGCTIANRDDLLRDAPKLAEAARVLRPAFTFWSCEPLLGDLGPVVGMLPDWVITGGETDQGGHQARPSHPAWFRSLRDQCAAAGVAYQHKHHGEWAPICWMDDALTESIHHPAPARDPEAIRRCKVPSTVMHRDGCRHEHTAPRAFAAGTGAMTMFKVNKHRSGRAIDGVVHGARPEVGP